MTKKKDALPLKNSTTVKGVLAPPLYKEILEIAETPFVNYKNFKNKTILITGAGGFIAYYLICAFMLRNDLYGDNITIIALARNEQRLKQKYGSLYARDDFAPVISDICDANVIENLLAAASGKSLKADFIIHAASQASNQQFENDPVGTINANLSGTVNVLEYARKVASEGVLFISSLKVYGTQPAKTAALTESNIGYLDITSYKNCYAMGKRASETLCACYAQQYSLNIKIARPAYIYGASSLSDDRVWAQFIANAVKGENILLKGNGKPYRSFCYVTDTATALLKILTDGLQGMAYNIADADSNITIREFADCAAAACPQKQLKKIFANAADATEPHDYKQPTENCEILDAQPLLSLGWEPTINVPEGIKRAIEILKS
ncbi:MAG: NAD-dependent epimerase/dehydratase family protein [Oscillospiraceae bacterium]|jgi:nucleoside-diphosphate-sugar epimerase|nr:NAD-dependent epimerase/dehydratase family protein [Oscillospiraceae bacterium]